MFRVDIRTTTLWYCLVVFENPILRYEGYFCLYS